MVDNLPGYDMDIFWQRRIEADFREFVAGLSVRVEHENGRVLLKELPTGTFKLAQFTACPSDLDFRSVQWTGHG